MRNRDSLPVVAPNLLLREPSVETIVESSDDEQEDHEESADVECTNASLHGERARNEKSGLKSSSDTKKCVLMVTIGSRGDLNPFLALGEEFVARGYHVRIATHAVFKEPVERFGFEHWKIAGDPKVLMELMSTNSTAFASPNFLYKNYKTYRSIMKGVFNDMYKCSQNLPPGAHYSLIVANPISHCGIHLAEYLKIPVTMLFTMPWTRSKDFPFPLYLTSKGVPEPSILNHSTYGLFETALWFSLQDHINYFRTKQLNLPSKPFYESEAASSNISINGRKVPFMYCWSKLIIPKPKDWGKHIMISGYLLTKHDRKALLDCHSNQYTNAETPMQRQNIESAKPTATADLSFEKYSNKEVNQQTPENAISCSSLKLDPPKISGFDACPQLGRFLDLVAKWDKRGPLYIGFGSINAPPQEFRQIIASIIQVLHFLNCITHDDGKTGLPGSRFVIFQCLHHAEVVREELANAANMCTRPAHDTSFFASRKPLLSILPEKLSKTRNVISSKPARPVHKSASTSSLVKLLRAKMEQPQEQVQEEHGAGTLQANDATPFAEPNNSVRQGARTPPPRTSVDDNSHPILQRSSFATFQRIATALSFATVKRSAPGDKEFVSENKSKNKLVPHQPLTEILHSPVSDEQAKQSWLALQANVTIIKQANHSELFPRCSAIVHHGGAGTFMTSAFAGTAQLVVPFFGDQFLWADIARRLKVGSSIAADRVKTRSLLTALQFALRAETAHKAATLGDKLRAELLLPEQAGPQRAVDAIEAWANHETDSFDLDLVQGPKLNPRAHKAASKAPQHQKMPSSASTQHHDDNDLDKQTPSCQTQ